jgi:hypothetical protein
MNGSSEVQDVRGEAPTRAVHGYGVFCSDCGVHAALAGIEVTSGGTVAVSTACQRCGTRCTDFIECSGWLRPEGMAAGVHARVHEEVASRATYFARQKAKKETGE